MRRFGTLALGLALTLIAPVPALAGWKLVARGAPVHVGNGTLAVVPAQDWNRATARPIPKGESWTLDGLSLNQLYFVSGLAPGETLFRNAAKKDRPLPAMGAAMQLTDIPEFVESSTRVALDTSAFALTGAAPATLGGHPAVRFTYDFATGASALRQKGLAVGALVDGKLYLIVFTAPALFYFDRDAPKAEAILASATL